MRNALVRLARSLGVYHTLRRAKLRIRTLLGLRMRGGEARFYSQLIEAGDLVFDVGANVGIKTQVFVVLGASVVAVEPLPAALIELQAVFGRRPDVVIVAKALGARRGTARMHISTVQSGLSTMSERWIRGGRHPREIWTKEEVVEVVTLDDLIESHGLPAYCKIDVEGSEAEVLEGLSRAIDVVSFEFHSELAAETDRCLDLLGSLGDYRFNVAVADPSLTLALDEWVDAVAVSNFIQSSPDPRFEGEIFARLVR